MSILPLTIPPKKLAQTISSSDMTFKMNNIVGWGGANLTPADFGTEAYGVFINSTRTQIEVFKFDPATIASASVTILVRGLPYNGGDTSIPANKYPWPSNDTIVQLGTDAPQLFRDFMAGTNTATVSALHTYTTLPRSAVTPTNAQEFTNKNYVDGLTQPAITVPISQTGHGFAVGDVIRLSGVNTYAKAQANNAANAEAIGIVTEIVSPDAFKYITEGIVTTGVPVFAAGTVLFLSPTTAGALTDVEPSTVGQVSLPLATISESGVRMVFHKFRGFQINTIAGNPIASETTAGVVEQATAAQVSAGTDTGETGAPLFVVPSLMKPEGTAIKSTGETGGTKFLREDGDGTCSWQSVGAVNVQQFTANGTWTKPSSGNVALIEVWGGGGSGGIARSGTQGEWASGGGGGGYMSQTIPLANLPGTVAVTIGVGGAAVSSSSDTALLGNAGGTTTFGSYVRAFGGGAGKGMLGSGFVGGGGGGCEGSAGGNGNDGIAGAAGNPTWFAGAGNTSTTIGTATLGGAGGGAGYNNATYSDGASSVYGGGGGGGSYTNASYAGGASVYGGNGGAGAYEGNGAVATAGTQPAGGGGGATRNTSGTFTSGKGGDGMVRVTVF